MLFKYFTEIENESFNVLFTDCSHYIYWLVNKLWLLMMFSIKLLHIIFCQQSIFTVQLILDIMIFLIFPLCSLSNFKLWFTNIYRIFLIRLIIFFNNSNSSKQIL